MKRKFRIIPWFMTRDFYKLKGKDKEIAKIEYIYKPSYERDMVITKIRYTEDSQEYKKQDLWLQHHYGMITDIVYQKELSTLEGKPFIHLIDGKYIKDEYGSGQLSFEFEWNSIFVTDLKKQGYPGLSPDEIVNNWFTDVCRQIVENEYFEDI